MSVDPIATNGLSELERARLNRYEGVIHRSLKVFYEVGEALLTIREERLYREHHTSFDLYLRERWDMGRSTAYRLITSSQTYQAIQDHGVSAIGDTVGSSLTHLPATESQTRELTPLPPAERPSAWREAVEEAGGQPTARQVKDVVRRRTQPEPRRNDPDRELRNFLIAQINNSEKRALSWLLDTFREPDSKRLIATIPEESVNKFIADLSDIASDARKLIQLIKDNR